ncbi:5',5'''-P-1,P-4-tetraphosphate phosphorylase 2 [Drechmeria coniospora]|uniref:5',5'''-P-1,P-4-tetraphosphate phosphorylase 2 n=1 Tax=Drechmeria coniospora TaxID=98403 RepID=A0A151GHA3_DRECN|nr:5',5'''-P-1,P-4-tetraphosphate phosphorylase 2 [Drechmeria coniospora]KYK56466.1 5',5'''-P-1,P-4-tetraphosphate phosphorylase 2 [Drechmeria coniospora]
MLPALTRPQLMESHNDSHFKAYAMPVVIMPGPRSPANLPDLVRTAFAKARSAGDLSYFPTQVTTLLVGTIPLRFSPALANKPRAPPASPSQKPADPFANPPPSLHLCPLGPAHYLVLNKFAIVPEHFILATNEFKPQSHVLEEADLGATLACIGAYEGHGHAAGLFAFFNGGEHSGASQPHRHLQMLPVARMRDGLEEHSAWNLLADEADQLQRAPFVAFTETISLNTSPADLHEKYLKLYRRACRAVAAQTGLAWDGPEPPAEGEALISYNLAMTKNTIVVLPRLAEGAAVAERSGEPVGRLALNGTLLAGTALVKMESEWEALKDDPRGLADALRAIGIPREEFDGKAQKL